MDAHQPQAHPLIRKLESIFTLTGEEKQALIDLPMQVQELRADQDIVRERPCLPLLRPAGGLCLPL